MFDQARFRTAAIAFAVCFSCQVALAAPPWSSLIPFTRVEANANKSYELTENEGPWMIMAASFTGAGAELDARDLVQELRKEFGLEAYTFEQKYDFSDNVTGRGYDKFGNPKKMRYMKDASYTSYAVLIGNWESFDESGIQKTLQKVKTARPQVFDKGYSVKSDTLKEIREKIKEAIVSAEKKEKGPMGIAFVTRNPMLPEEYFRPKGLDPLLVEINQGPNSLLTCPGNYTVKVATFRGSVELHQKKIEELKDKAFTKSRLADAADKAEKLAAELRQQGVEAYSFHDRAESIVTVGSFSQVGTPTKDGNVEINPQVLRIVEGYQAVPARGKNPNLPGFQPKSLAGIPFDVQPKPMEVPKVSISAAYATPRR